LELSHRWNFSGSTLIITNGIFLKKILRIINTIVLPFFFNFRYDRKEANLLDIQDIQIWGAMGPPGGSRQEISPRCLRHFHIIAINPFSDSTMTHIFSTILTIHLSVMSIAIYISMYSTLNKV